MLGWPQLQSVAARRPRPRPACGRHQRHPRQALRPPGKPLPNACKALLVAARGFQAGWAQHWTPPRYALIRQGRYCKARGVHKASNADGSSSFCVEACQSHCLPTGPRRTTKSPNPAAQWWGVGPPRSPPRCCGIRVSVQDSVRIRDRLAPRAVRAATTCGGHLPALTATSSHTLVLP